MTCRVDKEPLHYTHFINITSGNTINHNFHGKHLEVVKGLAYTNTTQL